MLNKRHPEPISCSLSVEPMIPAAGKTTAHLCLFPAVPFFAQINPSQIDPLQIINTHHQ
jgi:hypothetical protein